MATDNPDARRPRSPSRPYPVITLKEALRIPQGITDNNAGRPMKRLLLADALDLSPGSSLFRDLIAASARYGLTEGNFNSDTIALTSIGQSVTRPTSERDRLDGLRAGLRKIDLFDRLLNHYNGTQSFALPGDFLSATARARVGRRSEAWSKRRS